MSDMLDGQSLASQRFAEYGQQVVRIADQLVTLHPDSPEAAVLRNEIREKTEKLSALHAEMMAELPWHLRLVIQCVGWTIRAVVFCGRPLHRFYHTVKGLL